MSDSFHISSQTAGATQRTRQAGGTPTVPGDRPELDNINLRNMTPADRAYAQMVHGDIDQVLEPGRERPPIGNYGFYRSQLMNGDFSQVSKLPIQQRSRILTELLNELCEIENPNDLQLSVARKALNQIFLSDTKFHGEGGFWAYEQRQAARTTEEQIEQGKPRRDAVKKGLKDYHKWVHRNKPESLLADLSDPDMNMYKLHFRLEECIKSEGRITLTDQQKQTVVSLIRERIQASNLEGADLRMSRFVLQMLDPEMTANQWADLCSDCLEKQLENDELNKEMLDSFGIETLGKALKNAKGESRARLLKSIRRLYPRLEHTSSKRRLLEESGASDRHGHFVLPKAEGAGPSKDPYFAQIDRMTKPGATGEDYRIALSELRKQGKTPAELANFYTDAYRLTGDAKTFLDPLLSSEDKDGKSAYAIAKIADDATYKELREQRHSREFEPGKSVKMLELLAEKQDSAVARGAAGRILNDLATVSREKTLVASPELVTAMESLSPSPSLLKCCNRLLRSARGELRERLQKVRQKCLDQEIELPKDLKNNKQADEQLRQLSYQLAEAMRAGDTKTADALKAKYNKLLKEVGGLPEGDYLPEWALHQVNLWGYGDPDKSKDAFTPTNFQGETSNQGSLVRDFINVANEVPEGRKKVLMELLGKLPQTAWKDNPLGFARGTRLLVNRSMDTINRHGRKVSNARFRLNERYLRDSERTEREAEFRELRRQRRDINNQDRGLVGRLEAARDLGSGFDQLAAFSKANDLKPEQFDRLLMVAGTLAAEGHSEAVGNLLRLASQGGMSAADLQVIFSSYKGLPENVRENLGKADSSEKALSIVADRFEFEMRERARNPKADLFKAYLQEDMGEEKGSFLVRHGRGAALMVDPTGGNSLIDTLLSESTHEPAAQMGGKFLLEQLEKQPGAVGRLAKVQRIQFRMREHYISNKKEVMEELKALRRPLGELNGEERRVQQLVNVEVSTTMTELQSKRRGHDEKSVRGVIDDNKNLSGQIDDDTDELPEELAKDPALRRASGQLQASKQILNAQRILADQTLSDMEKDRKLKESLKLQDGMTHRAIRGMIRLAVDSPTDSVYLGVDAKVGVEVSIPFFGSVRAFVQGKAGFEIQMAESGRVSVSFNAEIGGGADAESGYGKAKAEARAGAFQKVSMVFANEDEAAKFIQSILAQLKMAEEPPTFAEPMPVDTNGTYVEASGEFQKVKVFYKKRDETSTLHSEVPWLPPGRRQKTTVHHKTEEGGASVEINKVDWGLSVLADDKKGSRNQTDNGTTLTIAFTAGVGAQGGGVDGGGVQRLTDSPQQAFIDNLYESVKQMRPELLKNLTEEQAKGRLLQAFTSANLKASVTVKGKIELTMATPENLMHEKGMNAMGVLFNFVENALSSDDGRTPWHFYNLRRAREIEASASASFSYGAGVKVFAELGIEFKARDATTMVGGLYHAREVLYDYMRGAAFSETQLEELQKDGLLHKFGPERGTLKKDAFIMSLGMMRNELIDLWDKPGWKEKHAPGVSRADFEKNIDSFLEGIIQSMHAGLRNNGRTSESFDQFKRSISMDKVRQADQFIEKGGLQKESNNEILRQWQEHSARA